MARFGYQADGLQVFSYEFGDMQPKLPDGAGACNLLRIYHWVVEAEETIMAAAGRPGFPRRGRRAQQYADHLADDADGLEAEKGGESVAFPGGGESARAG